MTNPWHEISSLRILLARAGERGNLSWWDSEAFSSAGAYVLRRIYPRVARSAAVRLSVEAATAFHRSQCPHASLHLYDFGPMIEHQIEFVESDDTEFAYECRTMEDLRGLLVSSGVKPRESENALALEHEGPYSLGKASEKDSTTPAEIAKLARQLASAYCFGRPGQPVLPYLVVS